MFALIMAIERSILHESHLAEDAVSEDFLKIIDNLEKIKTIDCYQTRGFTVWIVSPKYG
jgi:RNA polymerase sigma-70 factor (ECF subfamily)